MLSRLFAPTLSHRLFDPMPLPRRFQSHSRAKIVDTGRSLVPKNRVSLPNPLFAAKIKRIPTNS